jgi:hypothetical protein
MEGMTPYKVVPLVGGKFALAIDDGGEHPTLSGPYKTKSAARAHMAEYERLARIVAAID